jgi:hypothetical protein
MCGGAGAPTLRFLKGGIPRSLTAWDFSLTFELTDSWSNTIVFIIIDRSRKQGEKDGVPGSPPVAERGGVRDLELGEAVERVRVVAAPATILKESLKGTGRPGMCCDGGDIEPQPLGL